MQVPAPGGPPGEYWEVFYTSNQSSRFGGPAEDKVITVLAGSQAAAQADALRILGNDVTITSVDGPYGSSAAAGSAGSQAQKTQGQESQAGHLPSLIPSFGLIVSGISGWFFRGLKVLFGGVLVIIGVSKLTGADNKIVQLASKVPVVPV